MKRREATLIERLVSLNDMSAALARVETDADLLAIALRHMDQLFDAERIDITVLDDDPSTVQMIVLNDEANGAIPDGALMAFDEAIPCLGQEHGELVQVDDMSAETHLALTRPHEIDGYQSMLSVGLLSLIHI